MAAPRRKVGLDGGMVSSYLPLSKCARKFSIGELSIRRSIRIATIGIAIQGEIGIKLLSPQISYLGALIKIIGQWLTNDSNNFRAKADPSKLKSTQKTKLEFRTYFALSLSSTSMTRGHYGRLSRFSRLNVNWEQALVGHAHASGNPEKWLPCQGMQYNNG